MANMYDPTRQSGSSLDELMQDPEFLDLMSQMGYLPAEQGMPQGMNVGGTFRAAHPLEFLSAAGTNIFRNLKGRQMNRALAEALRGKYGGQGMDYSMGPAETYEGT
jgi:hypothetical protein